MEWLQEAREISWSSFVEDHAGSSARAADTVAIMRRRFGLNVYRDKHIIRLRPGTWADPTAPTISPALPRNHPVKKWTDPYPADRDRKPRKCMSCQKMFDSWGKGHRMCDYCKALNR